ncbi:MAG: deoxyhypusine synthase [Candidatus Diapherotrites archaeon]|uniref:Deoxyhypusine synthase n=1 Tax=Candidatus Iainarchaeum sp. TaxID=3101447 RepID=A0A8T4C5I8_9ARCH|nr:deoxyhypusine synthase [Candidatus Diapherotrites archaeon]
MKDAYASIFKKSVKANGVPVSGINFDEKVDISKLIAGISSSGFQATHLGKAIELVKKMRAEKVTIFLGYTSNQISSGNREIIRYLVQHKLVDALVTTAGGIEEDFIKTHAPFFISDFRLDGAKLRAKGINRIGNLLAPNERYIWFEKFFQPILEELVHEQEKTNHIFSASEIIFRMGEKINHHDSIYYWAHQNKIPVFCPAFMDGAIGDNCYFFNYNRKHGKKLIIDQIGDHHKLIEMTLDAKETGIIVLGSSLVKHTLCNANMYREGAKYAVYMTTAQEFDGSDSGAEPEEAKSWGKIAADANTVKVVGDTTILLPLLVVGAFAKK